MKRPTPNKAKAIKNAKAAGRKVIWKDDKGLWHAATNRNNTPYFAVETEDVDAAQE